MPARTFFQDSPTPPSQPISGNSMQSIPLEIPPYSGYDRFVFVKLKFLIMIIL